LPGRQLVVEADGGSRGNPGVAGFGALVRDVRTRRVLLERAEPLGTASNNVAEYSGLIAGLEGVLRLAADADVEVRMDSKLVVEQMAGRWQIKHEDMRRLAAQARALVRQISEAGGRVRFTWIPRADNAAADALSNLAMDGRRIDRLAESDDTARDTTAPAAEATPTANEATTSTTAAIDSGRGPVLTDPHRIVLVRHAVTDNTVSGRLDGRGGSNPPLNALGQAQAQAAARAVATLVDGIPVSEAAPRKVRVVTSSLARAMATGDAIAAALGVDPIRDRDWDERSFGEWDGLTFEQIAARHPAKLARMRMDPSYPPPGGESRADVAARVHRAWSAVAPGPGVTIVVTSRVPILVVLNHLLGIAPERFWALATDPASISVIDLWADGNLSVPAVNRVDHLTEVERS
jgi:broad specificity phosphatase PhoE/ribonuclease HI